MEKPYRLLRQKRIRKAFPLSFKCHFQREKYMSCSHSRSIEKTIVPNVLGPRSIMTYNIHLDRLVPWIWPKSELSTAEAEMYVVLTFPSDMLKGRILLFFLNYIPRIEWH